MAMDQAERDRRRREKSAKLQEEDLRLKVRPGTKQALEWVWLISGQIFIQRRSYLLRLFNDEFDASLVGHSRSLTRPHADPP
ncbi:hypothetical protein [Pseudomonas sp. LF19]|uniref:hypothetical protein n=1 Tax=Pseudomonas sp. LF19 TaxID=2899115 RepID=UPI001F38BCD9|nr:hypothetical protein [Pseudomonas sp. LF19]MCE5982991.1 hypothetical protein [Pseudomonas sp. LF19]